MVERLRLFKGSTELNYDANGTNITRSSDQLVDAGSANIEGGGTGIVASSTIDFKKADGITTVFTTKVNEITKGSLWNLKLFTNEYELNNVKVEQVYTSASPEGIISDVITNFTTNLTDTTTASSGVTIDKYIANAYAIDVIKDMLDVLQWQLVIDENDNVTAEPKGNTNNGVVFTNGDNFNVAGWKEDKNNLFNHVQIIGGFESFNTTETIVDTNTIFTLSNKPGDSMKAVVSGSEVAPADYTVDAEELTVTFDSSKTDPTFTYSYNKPVKVDDQNDLSISDHDEIFREINAPWLNTTADARRYASNLLDVFSQPLLSAKGRTEALALDINPGELIRVIDNIRGFDEQLVVTKIIHEAAGFSRLELGHRDSLLYDWQREVEERVKKIERRFTNQTEITFARLNKHNLKIVLTPTVFPLFNSPCDSFILNHETLGRLRTDLNFEADCSDNSNNGTWSGTGIGGSQYTLSGFRLSSGQFNGTDRIITVTDVANLRFTTDFSIALAVKVDTLPGTLTYLLNKWDGTDGYAVRITASNEVELIYSDTGADSTITASTALTAGQFQHIVFTKSGTALEVYINGVSDNTDTGGATVGSNTNDLEIGKYTSNFFTGDIDEVRLYSDNISAADALNIFNRITVTTNQVCYLSMDNPKLGDRTSPKLLATGIEVGGITSFGVDMRDTSTKSGLSTADWDGSLARIRMNNATNKNRAYNTQAQFIRLFHRGSNYLTGTLTWTESKWGNDVILGFLSPDGGATYEPVTNGVAHTFNAVGTDIRPMFVFVGSGGIDTYVDGITVGFT